jgi:hypothetical protein
LKQGDKIHGERLPGSYTRYDNKTDGYNDEKEIG